jgi:cytochrome b561
MIWGTAWHYLLMPRESRAYGTVARVLHWTMFIVLSAQFIIGYAIERFDDLLEAPVKLWLGGEEDNLLIVHAGLGVTILALALVRVVWRLRVGLPPWAETLSAFERRLAHRTEVVLYALMFLIPVTGLALLFVSGEDWDLLGREWEAPLDLIDDDLLLGAHISAHLLFFVAIAAHLGLMFKHQLVNRDGLLRRML